MNRKIRSQQINSKLSMGTQQLDGAEGWGTLSLLRQQTVPERSLLVEDGVFVDVRQWVSLSSGPWLLLNNLIRQLEPQWPKNVT